jgi:flagellar basal-body rod modification protein FlgD
MMIQPIQAASASSSTPKASATSGSAQDTSGAYLQLLVAELQSQDPTSPLDPNQMTAQIVSLNQLDQLIQIRELLQGIGN